MNGKSSIKYQLNEMKRPVLIFYFVMLCILVFGFTVSGAKFVITSTTNGVTSSTTSGSGFYGLELATIVFLFVAGLNSFKEFFRMFIQNGVSRKTMFVTRIISIITLCTGMAVIDKIILLIGKFAASRSNRIHFDGLFEFIYGTRTAQISSAQMHLESFLFNLCLYLAVITIGYFITIGFYRMNKIAKISVAIGVPMVLLNGLPLVDAVLLHGVIGRTFINTFLFAFGFKNGANPYYGMVSCLVIFAVFAGLSWLIMRKAVVKD